MYHIHKESSGSEKCKDLLTPVFCHNDDAMAAQL